MPVTKTAKRALRASLRKQKVNNLYISRLEIAMRKAKKTKSKKDVTTAISLVDRASKKRIIHPNKAGRIKNSLGLLMNNKLKKKSPKK